MKSIRTDNLPAEESEPTSKEILLFLKNVAPYERLILSAIKDDEDLYRLAQIPRVGHLLLAEVLASVDEDALCKAVSTTYFDPDQLNELLVFCGSCLPRFRDAIKRSLILSQAEEPNRLFCAFRLSLVISTALGLILAFFTTFVADIGFENSTLFFVEWRTVAPMLNTVLLMLLSMVITWLMTYKREK